MVRPKIFIILLHFRDIDVIQECLASLNGVSYKNFKVLIVHNGRPDAELEKRVASFPGLLSEVIHTGENYGFAKGNNIGIRLALQQGADYVLLLNDDTAVDPGFLEPLVLEAVKDPSTGMLGPRVFYFSEPKKIWFTKAEFNAGECSFCFPGSDMLVSDYGHEEICSTDYVTGCALLVSRKLIKTVGLLDERFFLYWEDSDWGLRACAAGFKSLVVPSARIWHKVSASSGGNDSPLKAYHKTRGQLLFADLHAPLAKKRLIFGFIKDILWLLLKSKKKGRLKRAAAILAGIIHHFTGSTGVGPAWLV